MISAMKDLPRKNWTNATIGIILIILPFLGLPQAIKTILFVILGVLVLLFALARMQNVANSSKRSTYTQNGKTNQS